MKTSAFVLSLLLLTGATSLTAQEAAKASIPQLIEQLGDPDYGVRKAAETTLLQRGDKALDALRKSAGSHTDPEVQWRASRLVRKIEGGGKGETKKLEKRDRSEQDIDRDRGEDRGSKKRISRDLDDVIENLERSLQRGNLGRDFPQNLDEALKQMRNRIRELEQGMPKGGGTGFQFVTPPDFGQGQGEQRTVRMRQGPNGIRVEITELDADGKKDTKIYEADNLESFQKKYPDLLKKNGLNWGVGIGSERSPFSLRSRRGTHSDDDSDRREPGTRGLRKRGGWDEQEDEARDVQGEGPKLGVYVADVAPAVRDYLQISGGLMIQDVVPGSLAEKVGVAKGDILVKVAGTAVRSVEDVSAALRKVGEHDQAKVVVVRRGRELELGQAGSSEKKK